jgi:Putative phage tail protein
MPGSIIAVEVLGLVAGSWAAAATAFAINMVVSSVIAKTLGPSEPGTSSSPDPGSRAQVSPAGNNKLPVVYGTAYVGGIITDISLSPDNQKMHYCLALSEVTNTETGGTPDTITFGTIYYSGKICQFASDDATRVIGLLDPSTGLVDNTIDGSLFIYLYRNGSSSGANTSLTAQDAMNQDGVTYTWDATKLMSNCAFAIVRLIYNRNKGVTGLQQTRFQLTNSRKTPGACFTDYLTSSRYGAAIPVGQIDATSLAALDAYSSQTFTFTTYTGSTATQPRFQFNGTIDTSVSVMSNLQLMSACCDCQLKYNEMLGLWGVVVQSPTYVVALPIDDSNMISGITITPTDLASSYNIAEVKYPNGAATDSFSTTALDLATVAPSLLYPNEPVNKQTISLPLVNNDVCAQYLATRFLKGAREDLQVQVRIGFSGLQLEAGDIVTVTSVNYGWSAKLFRVTKVVETFGDDGTVTAALSLGEYNPTVYNDASITQFTPAPNTGISDPAIYGTVPAPVISNIVPVGYEPSFDVTITTSSAGITQYAELWYATTATPTSAQLTLYGTTEIAPNGNPYPVNTALPKINVNTLEAGVYYFFSRMRNSLRASVYSPASVAISWNPTWVPDVTGFISAGTSLSWSPVNLYRLAGYKLRYQYGINYDWGSANNVFDGIYTTTTFDASSLPSSRITILVKAVDTLGHESVNAASLVLTPGGLLTPYIVYSYDFKANGWPGTITGATVIGGNIVANVTDSLYGEDDQSFYGLDTDSFYDLTSVSSIVYETSQIVVSGALTGSIGALSSTVLGKDITVEYRRVNGESFYGADGNSFYGPDAESFYGVDGTYSLMPGALVMANDVYQFRITVGAGTVGEIDAMLFQVDAPVITELVPNFTVTGGTISYTSAFTSIKGVLATLQANALGVVTLETNKTSPLAPTITGYNVSHTAVSGAKADITLQGY